MRHLCPLQVYEHVIVGLIFHHLMMLGVMGLKKFPFTVLILPLPFLTIFFKIYVDRLFKRPLTMLSLRAARDLDELDVDSSLQTGEEKEMAEAVMDSYRHACFKIDWEKIEATCNEVSKVSNALEMPHDEAAAVVAHLNISEAPELYQIDSFALSKSDIETANQDAGGSEATKNE